MNRIDIDRRAFLKGSGSLLGWGMFCDGCAFGAAPGLYSQGKPNLVVGIISDIHIRLRRKGGIDSFEGESMFRKALEWFRDQGVDGVTISGDMADHGLLEELDAVARIWSSVFPDDKAPDGRRVERLFVYGNHDWEGYRYGGNAKGLFGEEWMSHTIRADLGAAWKRAFHEDYVPVWRKEVKGYTFVGGHWTADRCRSSEEIGVPEGAEWFNANGKTIDPSKPFFYLQHPPPKGTCHGDWLWGHDDGRLTKALSPFPNAIAITGHSHATVSSDCAIWQGAFTAIDAGSLKYTGLEYRDLAPFFRENDSIGASREEIGRRVMGRVGTHDGHQGMIARVYDDRIVFERRDFDDMGFLGPDWVFPLPAKAAEPAFAFAPRAAASAVPEFPDGAVLAVKAAKGKNRGGGSVKSVPQDILEISIPAANRSGCVRAFDFAVEIEGTEGGSDSKFVFSDGFHRSSESARANATTVCRLSLSELKSVGDLRIAVSPRNSFGKAGKPLSAVFKRHVAS